MKTLARILLISIIYLQSACGQPKNLNGVYAGVELTLSVTPGGAMGRNDQVYLFRPDGTYNDEIDKPDWKTRVTGHYKISGNTIMLQDVNSKSGKPYSYKFTKSGDIDCGAYNMLHLPMDSSIPQGYFKFSKMSSSGGIGSGTVYVGTSRDVGLYFDGKGRFTNQKSSATMVSGDGIGGGGGRKSGGEGNYTINKGVLNLKFDNGRTETHSFFCRPGYKPVMAVIDGDIYFMKDKDEEAKEEAKREAAREKRKSQNATGSQSNSSSSEVGSNTTTNIADAKALLLKANGVHGGSALDNIKSASFTASLQGLQITSYVDVAKQRVRLEARQNGKLVQVEQFDGNNSFQWQQGQTKPLPAVRMAEMASVFHSGILGLRKSEISQFNIKNAKQNGQAYSILAERDGKQYAFVFNSKGQMVASGDNAGNGFSSSLYTDMRQSGGILVPFQETMSSGGRKQTVRYERFDVNPNLPESTWAKP